MSVTIVCDADRKTVLTPATAQTVGFGLERQYSPEAMPVVEAYLEAVKAAAEKARAVFREEREAAEKVFRAMYPEGLLPDVRSEGE